jgi:hypothetical protein
LECSQWRRSKKWEGGKIPGESANWWRGKKGKVIKQKIVFNLRQTAGNLETSGIIFQIDNMQNINKCEFMNNIENYKQIQRRGI